MAMNFPSSLKIFGCNIASKQSYGIGTNYGNAWVALWNAWDWTGWIKPQIDFAVGECGCNCIRLIGSLEGVFAGTFSQSTYNTNWKQLIDYCSGLGVYTYFTGGWFPQVSAASGSYAAGAGQSMTDQNIADGINNTLSSFGAARNKWIIGVDAMQEQNAWGLVGQANPDTRTISIYNKIKAGGTGLPVTFSTYDVWTNASPGRSWVTSISSAIDYLDFHFYSMSGYNQNNPIAASDFNYWRTTYSSLDIIAGEFGDPQSNTYDQTSSFCESVLTGFNQGDAKVRGALIWASTDGNNVTSDEWGLTDVTFAQNRLQRTRLMRQFTGGYVAKAN